MTTLEGSRSDGDETDDSREVSAPAVAVTAHQSTPGRTVFVEEDNSDGWIASSLIVDLDT